MGTLTAAGAIKCGTKRITATEAVDSLYALRLGGFTSYAKPGTCDSPQIALSVVLL